MKSQRRKSLFLHVNYGRIVVILDRKFNFKSLIVNP